VRDQQGIEHLFDESIVYKLILQLGALVPWCQGPASSNLGLHACMKLAHLRYLKFYMEHDADSVRMDHRASLVRKCGFIKCI